MNYQLFEKMELHRRMKGYRLYSLEQSFSGKDVMRAALGISPSGQYDALVENVPEQVQRLGRKRELSLQKSELLFCPPSPAVFPL